MRILFSPASLFVRNHDQLFTLKRVTSRTFTEMQKIPYTYKSSNTEEYFIFEFEDVHQYSLKELESDLASIIQKARITKKENYMMERDSDALNRVIEKWAAIHGNEIIPEKIKTAATSKGGAGHE